MKGQIKTLAALSLLLMGLILAACGDNTSTSSIAPATSGTSTTITGAATGDKAQPAVKVAVGFTAPDFTAKDINGQSLKLSQFRGKAVLLNFWAVY